MKQFLKSILSYFERKTEYRLLKNKQVGAIFEEVHLKRLLSNYSVDCVIDIGANKGQYAQMLRKKVGYKGLIISYEPIPELFNYLKILSKSDKNWVIYPYALDEFVQSKLFNVMKSSVFSSLKLPESKMLEYFEGENEIENEILLETRTLSNEYFFLKSAFKFSRPFLKLDTQGNDLPIVRGAKSILNNFIAIQTELSIKSIYQDVDELSIVLDWFKKSDFSVSAFVPNNGGNFPFLFETDVIFINNDFVKHIKL